MLVYTVDERRHHVITTTCLLSRLKADDTGVCQSSLPLTTKPGPLTATNWLFFILMMSPTTTWCQRSSVSTPLRSTHDLRLFTWLSLRCRCYGDRQTVRVWRAGLRSRGACQHAVTQGG